MQETNDESENPSNAAGESFADDEQSEENLDKGNVFEIRDSVLQHPPSCSKQNHFSYDGPPYQDPGQTRKRLINAVPISGRPVDERTAIRERTADILGRLVAEGDVIKYCPGFLK